ncbi:MAG: hypothetical protein EOP10_30770 [Proteobacteria bacterium]|nr:MAG: hypothetical protein EOP10_30770 [Pseudomonadota bacterium]
MRTILLFFACVSASAFGQSMFDNTCNNILSTEKKAAQPTNKDQTQIAYDDIMNDFRNVNTFGGSILYKELMKLTANKIGFLSYEDDLGRNRVLCAANAKGELAPVIITKSIDPLKGKKADLTATLDAKYGKPIKSFEEKKTLTQNKNEVRTLKGFGTVVASFGDLNSPSTQVTYYSEAFVNSVMIPAVAATKVFLAGSKQQAEADAKAKDADQKAKLKSGL